MAAMAKPFENTMELVNNFMRPGVGFLKESPDKNSQLQGLGSEFLVSRFDEVAAAMADGNRKVALYEFGLMPQLFFAFDCAPFCLETYPYTFASFRKDIIQDFIAVAEEAGAPSDVCSTDRFIIGAALAGEMPDNSFFVTSSSPCDGTRIGYPIIHKALEIPGLYLEAPYSHRREAARFYGAQIKARLIPFLEEVTGKKFDIDRFREIVQESNRAYELMVDLNDTFSAKPCPLPNALRGIPYMAFIYAAGHPGATQINKLLYDEATHRLKESYKGPFEEKYRVFWVHVPPYFDTFLFNWMEEELGAPMISSSLASTPILDPIDTSSLDSMLEGYAWQGLDMTMSLMRYDTVKLLDFTLQAYHKFNCDCIFVTQHVGCNSICGAAGIMRKYFREKDIPSLFIELDYNDDRILSSDMLRSQIEEFFNTVMA
jgi:benzoyl-CoA reductase subunit B